MTRSRLFIEAQDVRRLGVDHLLRHKMLDGHEPIIYLGHRMLDGQESIIYLGTC